MRRDITDYISSRRRATRLVSRGGRSSRLGGDLAAKFSSFLAVQVVPQIDLSVKLYNHGEGPY